MKVAIIGRSEILYDAALSVAEAGHQIVCVVTSKEAPEYTRTTSDFEKLAERLQVPYVSGSRISEYASLIRDAQADIGVSFNYTGIVPEEIIRLFPHGILNAHGGDLPRYRGNACQAWAILNGESRIGLCIHKMVGGEIDSGPIIARDYLSIDDGTKVGDAWGWMNVRIPTLFVTALKCLEEDPCYVLEGQSDDLRQAMRCYPRRPEDGRVNWAQDALAVVRLINASGKPYQGAFCEYEGQKLVIWDAELVNDYENFCAIPGQVTSVGNGFIEVACGKGKLRIKQVEVAGKDGHPDAWIKSIRKRLL